MFLRLTLPNGNTIDSDINVQGYTHTQVYYNELSPADDSIKLTVPFSVELSNALKSFINENIAAVVYGEADPVFTGFVRKDSSMSKSVRNQDIAIELVPASFLMNEVYGINKVFQNTTVGAILTEVFQDKGYGFSILTVPSTVIKFASLEEKTNVKQFVQQILYECGYTYTFTADGRFTSIPLFNSKPSVITQEFHDGDNGNMYGAYTQQVKERSVNAITATFNEITYKSNQTVFDDTSSRTIQPGAYLFDNSTGEYLTYDCDGVQSVLYVDAASVEVSSDTKQVSKSFTNWYTKGLLIAQNTGNQPLTVSRIKVTGSGWFVVATSQSKTSDGNKVKDITLRYTFDKDSAEVLVKNVADYYKYSSIHLQLKSYADFAVGSFCTVTAEGAGSYTCRIIRKVLSLTSDMIEYELESVLEYTPAESTTDTDHGSNTGNFYDLISADNNISPAEKQILKKEFLTIESEKHQIAVNAEAAGVITSSQYRDYTEAYSELNDYIDSNGIFSDMESITTIEDREAFNALYTAYYAARDAINERITQAYIESQGGDIFKDAIPSLVISNTVVKVHNSTDEWSDYEPSSISFYGHVSNGEYSAPYMGIFEVYRNGSETPFYKSIVPELSASFTIEDGTTSIRIVMRNSLGQIIYDREDIDFITEDSGVTLHLSNKYQSFYSGSLSTARAGEGVFFETEISAYNGLEQRPVHIGEIEAQQGFTFRTEGNKILFFPTGEIGESGTIGISATVEVTDGKVVGIKNGATPLVVGTKGTAIVAGKYESDYVTEFFNYINIDDEESRYTIVTNSGRYYGPYSSIDDVPGTVRKGDYILYTGESGEKYKKGLTYVFDGVNFTLDDSKEHQMASITDMLEMIDANTDGDAVALLLVDRLVTNTAFINRLISNNIFTKSLQITDGGSISGGYVPDQSGFLLNSNGYFECNNGKFVGDIDAGMIQISHMSPGVISIDYGGIDVFTFCENLAARDFEPQITYYGQGTYNGEYVNQFWYDYSTSATKTTTVEAWKNGGTQSVWGWPSGSILPKKASVRIIDYYKYTVKTTEKRVKIVFGDNIVVDKTYRMVTVTTAEKYSAIAASTVNGFESNYPYIYSTTDKKVYQVAGNSNMGFTRVKAVNMTTPKAESYNPDSIGELSFRLNVDSPTFKMTNIPYYSENLEDWSVYRTTDGTIKIKLPQ